MPQEFLLRSVRRLLGEDVAIAAAAYVWQRRAGWLAAVVISAVVAYVFCVFVIDSQAYVIGIAVGSAAMMGVWFTDQWVFAATPDELVRMRGSKIRRVARSIDERIPTPVRCEQVSDAMVVSTWKIADEEYTVPRAAEKAMLAIADAAATTRS